MPANNVWQAARYLVPGLTAHDLAMQGGVPERAGLRRCATKITSKTLASRETVRYYHPMKLFQLSNETAISRSRFYNRARLHGRTRTGTAPRAGAAFSGWP